MKDPKSSRRYFLIGFAALLAVGISSIGKLMPARAAQVKRLEKWTCTNQDCDPYIYDPSIGDVNVIDPENPIAPGVAFEDLPENWICPVCADPKSYFVPSGEWVSVSFS